LKAEDLIAKKIQKAVAAVMTMMKAAHQGKKKKLKFSDISLNIRSFQFHMPIRKMRKPMCWYRLWTKRSLFSWNMSLYCWFDWQSN
jgi:hypothetical protein